MFKKYKRSGFTLIELVTVMVLISILVLMAVPQLSQNSEKAYLVKLRADAGVVEAASRIYNSNNGNYPIGAKINTTALVAEAGYGVVVDATGILTASQITDLNIYEANLTLIDAYTRMQTDGFYYVGESGKVYATEREMPYE